MKHTVPEEIKKNRLGFFREDVNKNRLGFFREGNGLYYGDEKLGKYRIIDLDLIQIQNAYRFWEYSKGQAIPKTTKPAAKTNAELLTRQQIYCRQNHRGLIEREGNCPCQECMLRYGEQARLAGADEAWIKEYNKFNKDADKLREQLGIVPCPKHPTVTVFRCRECDNTRTIEGKVAILKDILDHGSWTRVKELAKEYGVEE